MRPSTNGPRSMTCATTTRPFLGLRNSTFVPHGSVRCATPTRPLVSFWPHAVPLPYRPGPYHEMLRSRRQGLRLDGDGLADGLGSAWPSLGRLCSLGGLEQRRALIQVPGGPGPRIGGFGRHRRPADGSRDLHLLEEIRVRSVKGDVGT